MSRSPRLLIALVIFAAVSLILLNVANSEIILHSNTEAERSFTAEKHNSSWSYQPDEPTQWLYFYCPSCYARWRAAPLRLKRRHGVLPYLQFGARPHNFAVFGGNYSISPSSHPLFGPRNLTSDLFRRNLYAEGRKLDGANCWPHQLTHTQNSGSGYMFEIAPGGRLWPSNSLTCWR